MKKIFLVIGCIFLLTGCLSCSKKQAAVTTEMNETNEAKISNKEIKQLIKDAEKRLKRDKLNPVKEVRYDPIYYKKMHYESREEFIRERLDEKSFKQYSLDKVVVLQIYYKHREEVESMIYVKDKEDWKFLRRFN